MRLCRAALLVALILAALAPAAGAQAEDWIVTAGARLRVKPPYEGADAHVLNVLPTVTVRPADTPYRFNPPDGAAAVALIDTTYIDAGPVVRFRGGRGDDGRFAGLAPIPVAVEPGAFLAVWPTRWLRARVEARRGIRGHSGWVEDLGLDLIHTADVGKGQRWDASIGPRIGFGDARYMDTYFGVTPAEAAVYLPHVQPYAPGAGERYAGATVAAAYHLGKHWRANFDVTYSRLSSRALASPIVRTVGAGDQLVGGFGFTYTFGLHL